MRSRVCAKKPEGPSGCSPRYMLSASDAWKRPAARQCVGLRLGFFEIGAGLLCSPMSKVTTSFPNFNGPVPEDISVPLLHDKSHAVTAVEVLIPCCVHFPACEAVHQDLRMRNVDLAYSLRCERAAVSCKNKMLLPSCMPQNSDLPLQPHICEAANRTEVIMPRLLSIINTANRTPQAQDKGPEP